MIFGILGPATPSSRIAHSAFQFGPKSCFQAQNMLQKINNEQIINKRKHLGCFNLSCCHHCTLALSLNILINTIIITTNYLIIIKNFLSNKIFTQLLDVLRK